MSKRNVGELKPGQRARISGLSGDPAESAVLRRLMELGFLEGSEVELAHQAPFGGDPIAVRVRGALIALRRSEASLLEVEGIEEAKVQP